MNLFKTVFMDTLQHEEQHPMTAPLNLCFYFCFSLFQCFCSFNGPAVCLPAPGLGACVLLQVSGLGAPANLGTSPSFPLQLLFTHEKPHLGGPLFAGDAAKGANTCNCRQMVSLFSPEGVLPISPNSTLFLAFFYSQLLLTSNPLPSFSLFFSFRKIITWVQRDTHCVCVFVSVYIRELPFLCFDFHIKPGFHHSCWFQL